MEDPIEEGGLQDGVVTTQSNGQFTVSGLDQTCAYEIRAILLSPKNGRQREVLMVDNIRPDHFLELSLPQDED